MYIDFPISLVWISPDQSRGLRFFGEKQQKPVKWILDSSFPPSFRDIPALPRYIPSVSLPCPAIAATVPSFRSVLAATDAAAVKSLLTVCPMGTWVRTGCSTLSTLVPFASSLWLAFFPPRTSMEVYFIISTVPRFRHQVPFYSFVGLRQNFLSKLQAERRH